MQRMRGIVIDLKFESITDEIRFFKTIKPKFHSKLLYYRTIYNIELNRPTGGKLQLSEFLSSELYKLKLFFETHTAFYHYYRSNEQYLDDRYFVRHRDTNNSLSAFQFLYIDADPNFSTIYDYQVARILCNDILSLYLNQELLKIDGQGLSDVSPFKPQLSWTESKVALAELIYALYASGVFNGGGADLKAVSASVCNMFQLKIGNIYKVFEEIRLRKKNRTSFMDTLKQNLIKRMERDDNEAL